jgi:hypothetical protein
MSWTRIIPLLFSLTLMLQPAAIRAAPPGGLGPYRLGMKPADVQAVKDCGPYKPVKTTGGLECATFTIAGKTRNISFIFDPDAGLKKIQLWFAEAATPAAAAVAVRELITFVSKTYGAVESNGLAAGTPVTAKALMAVVDTKGKVQIKPKREPADAFVFASIFKDPTHGWFVFFYVQPPRTTTAPP